MSTTAPKPPTTRLLVAACLTVGTTLGMLAITAAGHLIYNGIPSDRLALYSLAILAGACVSGTLVTRYLLQKHRRDAWWIGFSTGEEPSAEVIQLRTVRGYEGVNRKFINGSPG